MRFQEILKGGRSALPIVTEHIAQAQEIAKAFHFGLGLRIRRFSKTIHQFVEEGDPFDILLGSHPKSRLLLKFARWQLRQIGRCLFLRGKAPSREKQKKAAIYCLPRASDVIRPLVEEHGGGCPYEFINVQWNFRKKKGPE